MGRTARSGQTRMRRAICGRTNHIREKAGTNMSRQYHARSTIATGLGAMSQRFYDAMRPLNVRDIKSRPGTPRGDRWEPTISVAHPDLAFDAIVCGALDRLPRQPRLRHPPMHTASTANAPFVFADEDLSLARQLGSNALVLSWLRLSRSEWPALR